VSALLDGERARYTEVLDSLGVDDDAAERLRSTARAVDDLRFAESGTASGGEHG